jgi:hypothetical protein
MREYLCACVCDVIDGVALCQALVDPRRSRELVEFTKDLVHSETSALMREHNDVIQMQQESIAFLGAELKRVQAERMDLINAHAIEVLGIHKQHVAEIQALHHECVSKLRQ